MNIEEKQLLFFGKVTAGITHELKNVFAIIMESCGLLEDIISLTSDEAFPTRQKFQKSLAGIQNQIDRGVKLLNHLNSFAHSPDAPAADVEIGQMLELIIALSYRFAKLKKVTLELSSSACRPLFVKTRPAALLMLLFYCIECCLSLMTAGGSIILSPVKTEKFSGFHIFCQSGLDKGIDFKKEVTSSSLWSELQFIVGEIGGNIRLDDAVQGIFIEIHS